MKILLYINTKFRAVSLSIYAENFRKFATGYLCITENISAALNDSRFLLVMICERVRPTLENTLYYTTEDFDDLHLIFAKVYTLFMAVLPYA